MDPLLGQERLEMGDFGVERLLEERSREEDWERDGVSTTTKMKTVPSEVDA